MTASFFVRIEGETFIDGPYETFEEAEKRQKYLQSYLAKRLRVWIESAEGEEILPLTERDIQAVQDWLNNRPENYDFCLNVYPAPELILVTESPLQTRKAHRLHFYRHWFLTNQHKRKPVGIDQFGRKIDGAWVSV